MFHIASDIKKTLFYTSWNEICFSSPNSHTCMWYLITWRNETIIQVWTPLIHTTSEKVKDIKTATVKLTILTKAVMFYDVWYLVTISKTTWRFLIPTLCFKVMTCAQHSVLYLSSHQTCSVCPRFVNYRKIKGKRTVSIRYCLIFARIFSLEQTSR